MIREKAEMFALGFFALKQCLIGIEPLMKLFYL